MARHLALRIGLVAVMTATTIGQPGCGVPSVVKQAGDWIVAFATETGSYIAEKAGQFANALTAAWNAFWGPDKVNNVIVDEDMPLNGTYDGVLNCSVEWGNTSDDQGRANSLKIKLDHPKMIRTSEDSTDWSLAPEDLGRIEELEKQLLRTS